MTDKPTRNEEEYFAREEAEKLHRLHTDKQRQQTTAEKDAEKKARWMRCGKCGYTLETIRWRNVDIDKCFRCGVILLDDGELEKLAGHEEAGNFLKGFFGAWKKP